MEAPAPSRRAGALGGRHRCRGSADTVDIAPPEGHARAPIRWTITTVIVCRMRPTTQLHRHRSKNKMAAKAKLRSVVLFESSGNLKMRVVRFGETALNAHIRIE